MATKGRKKVVGKDDLKRLMKEHQSSAGQKTQKIDSPICRYNSLGQISCVLCNVPVKNELLWTVHLQGRTHKENIAKLKAEKEQKEHAFVKPPAPPSNKKRKQDYADRSERTPHTKISKGSHEPPSDSLPNDFFDSKDAKPKPNKNQPQSKPRSILKTSSTYKEQQTDGAISGIGGQNSSESEEDEAVEESKARQPAVLSGSGDVEALESGVPADFFDQGIAPSSSADGSTEKQPAALTTMSEKIPEGFFDDPILDAKAREVEYRNKMDDEWELFQKEMKSETHASEAILAEDDEEANEERNITEIEEQLKKYSKITDLAKKKEELMSKGKESSQNSAEEENDDPEEDFDEFLDWRSKKVWK